jgi:tetratricopeptide (TPR) repeat protein
MLSLDGAEDYSEQVIEYLNQILEIDRGNVPAHFARARALIRAHHINEAVEEYLSTVRIAPERADYVYKELKTLAARSLANPHVMYALGTLEMNVNKYEDACKHLLQACELDVALAKNVIPLFEKISKDISSPLLDFSLARLYHLTNLRNSAISLYVRAHAHDTSLREPIISDLKKICAEAPHDVASRKGLAEIYYSDGNFDDVLDLVNEIVELDIHEAGWAKDLVSNILMKNPSHALSYYLLGSLCIAEEDYKRAIEVYAKLIEIAPAEIVNVIATLEPRVEKSSELLLYLGTLYRNTGEIKKALIVFDKQFSTDPSYADVLLSEIKEILTMRADVPDAYLVASKVFAAQHNYDKAIDTIKRAQQYMPENEELVLKEGQLQYEKGDVEKAIKLYTALLEKTKNRKAIYRLIKKAREEYFGEKIVALKGHTDDDRLKRAGLYLLMGKLSEAEHELDFLPQNDSSMKQQTLLKAQVYLKRNQPLDALEIMGNVPIDHDTAPVYADIHESLGSYEAAATVLRTAGITGMEHRIASYEKLAQDRRLAKGRYFVEGRSR